MYSNPSWYHASQETRKGVIYLNEWLQQNKKEIVFKTVVLYEVNIFILI